MGSSHYIPLNTYILYINCLCTDQQLSNLIWKPDMGFMWFFCYSQNTNTTEDRFQAHYLQQYENV